MIRWWLCGLNRRHPKTGAVTTILPANKISVPRQTPIGIVQHEAIFVGWLKGLRSYRVIENHKEHGVRWSTLEDFAAGQQVRFEARVACTREEQGRIILRAHGLRGRAYDPILFNCKHLANYALTGKPSSPQFHRHLALALIGAAFVGFVRIR